MICFVAGGGCWIVIYFANNKMYVLGLGIDILSICSYLTVFLWRRTLQNQGKDEFNELLKLLSIAQRAVDCNFDTSRV